MSFDDHFLLTNRLVRLACEPREGEEVGHGSTLPLLVCRLCERSTVNLPSETREIRHEAHCPVPEMRQLLGLP
jgi:hypothetical protein